MVCQLSAIRRELCKAQRELYTERAKGSLAISVTKLARDMLRPVVSNQVTKSQSHAWKAPQAALCLTGGVTLELECVPSPSSHPNTRRKS